METDYKLISLFNEFINAGLIKEKDAIRILDKFDVEFVKRGDGYYAKKNIDVDG